MQLTSWKAIRNINFKTCKFNSLKLESDPLVSMETTMVCRKTLDLPQPVAYEGFTACQSARVTTERRTRSKGVSECLDSYMYTCCNVVKWRGAVFEVREYQSLGMNFRIYVFMITARDKMSLA